MKHLYSRLLILTALAVVTTLSGVSPSSANKLGADYEMSEGQEVKGLNETGCIEVLEAKQGAQECKDSKAITLRLKVNCDKPVDVRVCVKRAKGGWSCPTYTNKKAGDEITYSECRSNGPYKVFKRDAGSNEAWPNP